jgi:hypothetical protein
MKTIFLLVALIGLIFCVAAYGQAPASGQSRGSSGNVSVGNTPLGTLAVTSIPNKLSYQGLLTTSPGAPAQDGTYGVKFEIFNDSLAGSLLWDETQSNVIVKYGTFSVMLGRINPLTGIFYQPLWIQITAISGPGISSPIVFAPRTELASTAFSLGPWLPTSGGYYLSYGLVGIGAPADLGWQASLDIQTGTWSSVRTKTVAGYSTCGFFADKGSIDGRNYLVLQTGGADRWSLGTMYNDDFSIFNWPAYTDYFHVSMNGNVGINTTSPQTKLDVNGSVQVKDSLYVGSLTQDGNISVYHNGSAQPIMEVNDMEGLGAQMTLQDELGNPIVYMRPNGWGEGGGIQVYRTTSEVGFEAWGDWWGLGEGYAAVYGKNRSIIFEPEFAGDASVQLPDSSISSTEILDEPGVATEYGPNYFFLANNPNNQVVDSVIINVPAAGKVIVDASGYANVFHTNGTMDNIAFNVLTDPSASIFNYGVSSFVVPIAEPGTGVNYRFPFACKNIFNVASPTILKVYLIVRHSSGASINSTQIAYSVINATYYPTTYGNTPVALSDFNVTSNGTLTSDQAQPIHVTYQTAEEFNSAKAQQFQAELDQLKAKIKALEGQLGSGSGGPKQQ